MICSRDEYFKGTPDVKSCVKNQFIRSYNNGHIYTCGMKYGVDGGRKWEALQY